MIPLLIEPTDVLFFRDAVPMSAGRGRGAGCRLPFPSTLHEALRSSLLRASGESVARKCIEGRPRDAIRSGNWDGQPAEKPVLIATSAFRSLRTIGPLPWLDGARESLLLPVPLDVTRHGNRLARLHLLPNPEPQPSDNTRIHPVLLPAAVTPPDKKATIHGWWTLSQMKDYLAGHDSQDGDFAAPVSAEQLWKPEYRVGVQIDPATSASAKGQLYAGTYLRPDRHTRFVAWADIADPRDARDREALARSREREHLEQLDWLLFGGEFRLARLRHRDESGNSFADPMETLKNPPAPPLAAEGPCLLKWVLITPAIFARGSTPGWCTDSKKDRAGGPWPAGRVCLDLPGRAHLVSWCVGKPRVVSGWDIVDGCAKPTQLAVPEGSVFYFLADSPATAAALARALHWRPRSDFYGEKGCGYGLVSFHVPLHPTSPDVRPLARALFES